jgi:ABC-type nitrate/sulfonate/bicarbonate transport system substrate-binding protein
MKTRRPLRVGFLPENDCAPLVMAQELGLYEKHGLAVELHSQASWKQIHDKIIHRELDAASAPGTLPFLIKLGLTPEACDCVSGLVLSLQGNAITISRELWRLGARDAATLRERLWQDRNRKTYMFGVAAPLSTQYAMLCQWLKSAKGPPCTDVRLESVPAEQLFPLLKLGYLDGYCAGEPWNSVAMQAGVGACLATSAVLAPLHPEKVLLVRKDFAEQHADEHERLIAALLEACRYCDQPEHRGRICEVLAQPQFVNAPVECLRPGLLGPFGREDAKLHAQHGLNIFHRDGANEPTATKAAWLTGRLYDFLRWERRPAGVSNVFRPDIFRRAQQRVEQLLPRPAPRREARAISMACA